MQLTHVLATFLLTAGSVLAQPPACLLAVLNTQDSVADVKSVCQGKGSDLQKMVQSMCPSGDQTAALAALKDTCKTSGVTLAAVSASTTNSSSNSTGSSSKTNGTSGSGSGSGSSTTPNSAGRLSGSIISVMVAGAIGAATFAL